MASHRPVHFEIPASNPEAVVKFYTQLFGWRIEKAPVPGIDYWMCMTGEGPGIDGGILRRMDPNQCVTNYVNVPQLEPMIEKAQSLGGRIIVPKSPVPGMGWFALALDPDNNPVGLWQADSTAK